MRICLRDTGGETWIAGSIYVQNLAHAIASLPVAERQDISVSVEISSLQVADALPSVSENVFAPLRRERFARALAKRMGLPLPAWARNPKRFDFVYPEEGRGGSRYGWAAWIPDFQHLYLPELFSARQRKRREADFARMARQAPVVVLSSRMARDDFERTYPDAHAEAMVLHFASGMENAVFDGDPIEVATRYEAPQRFFLVSNQFWVHKDHGTIAHALSILARAGDQPPTIVCTGGTTDYRRSGYFSEFQELIRDLGVADQFLILGHIPRMDQLQLMRASMAVIQPSRFEGWSTVVEDARALGKPLLLSDFPVHREQDPRDAHFFPVQDADALAQEMKRAAHLAPGPDPERELAARADNSLRVMDFGRQFLAIAHRVGDLRTAGGQKSPHPGNHERSR